MKTKTKLFALATLLITQTTLASAFEIDGRWTRLDNEINNSTSISPSNLLWSKTLMNEDGTNSLKTFQEALDYCTSVGARLPHARDIDGRLSPSSEGVKHVGLAERIMLHYDFDTEGLDQRSPDGYITYVLTGTPDYMELMNSTTYWVDDLNRNPSVRIGCASTLDLVWRSNTMRTCSLDGSRPHKNSVRCVKEITPSEMELVINNLDITLN